MLRLMIVMLLSWAATSTAQDFGARAPVKTPGTNPENVPNPALQGGDTIASARLIPSVPYNDSGTTAGYTNDYDEVCPYADSTSPDVVYKYVSPIAQSVAIDLCNSAFDTKLYVYDAGLHLIRCNDDFYFAAPCFVYASKIENVALAAGQTYYIVVDGYGTASGAYALSIDEYQPCALACPETYCVEAEPPLVDNYVDTYNGGCNTPGYPFLRVEGSNGYPWPLGAQIVCGVSGWYMSNGASTRDTDWFTLPANYDGTIEVVADAEYASYIFELTGTCAGGVTVAQQATAGPCNETTMTITGGHNATHWFWVGPTVYSSPDGTTTYDYVVWFQGLAQPHHSAPCLWPVAVETMTWGEVKALYR
jgi:hypothetical protein